MGEAAFTIFQFRETENIAMKSKFLTGLRTGLATAGVAFALMAPTLAQAANVPKVVNDLVAEAQSKIHTIDMDAYKKVVANPNGALIIDVREASEYAAGHVPGAINLPRGLIEWTIWKHVGYPDKTDMNRQIYVQCLTGGRASLAAKRLQDLGFTHVTAVVMDLRDWQKAGNPLVTSK